MFWIGPAREPGVMPLISILYLNRHDVSYWNDRLAICGDWKICVWEQRGSGFKLFPKEQLLAVVKCSRRDHCCDHFDVWLTVLSCKRSCEDCYRDEVFLDLLHLKLMFGHVIKAAYDNHVPRSYFQEPHLSSSVPEGLAGVDQW